MIHGRKDKNMNGKQGALERNEKNMQETKRDQGELGGEKIA